MDVILVAIELETESTMVLARAAQLASEGGSRLVLLHVIDAEALSHAAAASEQTEDQLRDRLLEHTAATLKALAVDCEPTCRTEVRVAFGAPHEAITRIANDLAADLVVMGAGRAASRPLSERILGSTTDRVVRTAPAPVLVVRRGVARPYRRVAVAVDFSPQSAAAASQARRLAPAAKIELIHVIDFPLTFEQAMLRVGTPRTTIEGYHAARIERSRRQLVSFARQAIEDGSADVRDLQGAPGPTLVRLSQDHGLDVLALGPHGRGIVVQALLGSVTQRVLKEAACDVLVASTRA